MTNRMGRWVLVGLIVAASVATASAANRKVRKANVKFAANAVYEAKGRIEVMEKRATASQPVRQTLVLRLKHLVPAETYTVWGDDPRDQIVALRQIAPLQVIPTVKGKAVLTYDAGTGFPFEIAFEQVAGALIQIRDGDGEIVLSGSIPALPVPKPK